MERTFISETPKKIGKKLKIAGWISTRRDHGKIVFFDVRDKSGVLQVVIAGDMLEKVTAIRAEWVVEITGEVKERPDKLKNKKIPTGTVEFVAKEVTVLTEAKTPPFPLETDGYEIGEESRLQYRYLDLRRERLHHNLKLRHRANQFIRTYLSNEDFIEIETPLLSKSTPEGARDYLVPSRLYPGSFFALPQSPQQYKQLLQIAGFERYFQIVRCFRDEDPRADRQPEFTQLDIEMSFVEQEDILSLIEKLYIELVKELFPEKKITKTPFPRIPYKEAMEKWGSDKPDLRKNKEDPNELAFAFIVDFPAFEWKEQEKRWDAVHHPFTRLQVDSIEEVKKDPGNILAHQYDLALNGFEIAGGSLRIFDPKLLADVFEFMGNSKADVKEKFGHLLSAFDYGVPPHGGIASGLDRLFAVLLGEQSIREVIAFPKTGDSRDLMMQAPSEVSKEQLRELRLEIKKEKKKK